MHAADRWASHLLPDFGNLIFGGRGSLASLKAPEGFFKHTGAQHWDEIDNNYHLQLPPPYNTVILGGGKSLLVHDPRSYILNDSEDKHAYQNSTSLACVGCMPRILISMAHVVPLILTSLGIESTPPELVAPYTALPKPFHITAVRIEKLQKVNAKAKYEAEMKMNFESAK
ncbi:hypothetical protein VE02_07155 [Pseudogymnoascus sp. 03VT05]|nr:hypothetical protein VE02_07155 [Pseudogymnoascus sp. 03VT05]